MASRTHAALKGPRHSQPPVWRWLPLRLTLAAAPAWLTLSLLAFNVSWATKVIVAIAFGVSVASPSAGLLMTAAVAPLGHLIAPLIGPDNFRISEAVVVAFLAGWLLRGQPDRRGPAVAVPAAGWLLAATIAASVGGLALRIHADPGALSAAIDQLLHAHYLVIGDVIGFVDAARVIEGLALVAATVMLIRRTPRLAVTLPITLAAAAAIAALSSVLLWRGIGSASALARFARIGYRVSGHVADVNAAGSYFAMIALLAAGMALREDGRRRVLWLAMAGASGIGLWFSESLSAMAATGAVVGAALVWMATARLTARTRAVILAGVIVASLGGGALRVRLLERDPSYHSAGFREQFNGTSLLMIRERPAFGVGIGQYYRTSSLFLAPELAWAYGYENAHNYFLQMASELGLVGFCLFAVWITAPFARTARALAATRRDGRLLGAAAGAAVFLITCLSGHPLLVSEVAYPFWMQFGLVTALAGSTLMNRSASAAAPAPQVRRASPRIVAAAAILIVLACVLTTAGNAMAPPSSQKVDGFYGWEIAPDGARFRWSGEYASLFVPANVTRVYVPVRLPTVTRAMTAMRVKVRVAGIDQAFAMVPADGTWATIDVRVPDTMPAARFKRVDLMAERTWQPAIYIAESSDLRTVGVQVGEPRLVP